MKACPVSGALHGEESDKTGGFTGLKNTQRLYDAAWTSAAWHYDEQEGWPNVGGQQSPICLVKLFSTTKLKEYLSLFKEQKVSGILVNDGELKFFVGCELIIIRMFCFQVMPSAFVISAPSMSLMFIMFMMRSPRHHMNKCRYIFIVEPNTCEMIS